MQMLGHMKECRGHIQLRKTTCYLKCSPLKKKKKKLSNLMGEQTRLGNVSVCGCGGLERGEISSTR